MNALVPIIKPRAGRELCVADLQSALATNQNRLEATGAKLRAQRDAVDLLGDPDAAVRTDREIRELEAEHSLLLERKRVIEAEIPKAKKRDAEAQILANASRLQRRSEELARRIQKEYLKHARPLADLMGDYAELEADRKAHNALAEEVGQHIELVGAMESIHSETRGRAIAVSVGAPASSRCHRPSGSCGGRRRLNTPPNTKTAPVGTMVTVTGQVHSRKTSPGSWSQSRPISAVPKSAFVSAKREPLRR